MGPGAWRQIAGNPDDVGWVDGTARRRMRLCDSGRDAAAATGPVVLTEVRLPTGYELRARMTVSAPPSGSTDCSVDLLFDAVDAETGYRLRLRELNGVRYCSLLRGEAGEAEPLVDGVFGYSFETPLDIRVVVDGLRIEAWLGDRLIGTVNDVRRLRCDAVGFAVHHTCAVVEPVEVTELHDEPLPSPVRSVREAIGRLTDHVSGPRIQNDRYRIDFGTARWADDETTVTAAISVRLANAWVRVTVGLDGSDREQCVGNWYLLSGDYGRRADLYGSLVAERLRFTAVERTNEHTAVLRAEPPGCRSVTITWSLAGSTPRARIEVTPATTGHHVVAYHGFLPRGVDEVREVLCGPLQHGALVRGPEVVGAAELPAPMCLVETALPAGTGTWTWGLFVPPDELEFADEMVRDPDDQPFGMCLRSPDGAVQPTVVLPQYGRRAHLRAGETTTSEIGLYVAPEALYPAYRSLLRSEYGYRPYRGNVFGCSLTDTMHNLIDLLACGPDADDSVAYQASPSGWWGRAKGYIDIENDQAVRATTTAVLLSAAYLTADMDLYDERARPIIEFHLSRNGYGWTPVHGYDVYADSSRTELCATPLGVTALGSLHAMTRRQNPAVARLAETDIGANQDYWLQRAPMCAPLAAYRLTGDAAYLERARELADAYIAERIDRPATRHLDPHDFAIYYCADWIGLLEMYEETGETRYLDAAVREARRFVTQIFVRPIHEGTATVPDRPVIHDRQIELSRWWDPGSLYDYPHTDIEPEQVERWLLSLTGLSFEALQTYRFSGSNLNPAWAPHLLRLGYHADDELLRDTAHNAAIGRFTNYPGYYLRQHTVHHMKPDFPYTGPFDNTTIYYHHAPAQLGMTIDYLLTEHETRSRGRIRFPAEFEENYVWFRFRVYGHRPGSFYGDDDVWLWLPRGLVSLDTSTVNWLAARSAPGARHGRFYLSLTNSSAQPVQVGVRFGEMLGIPSGSTTRITVIADGEPRPETMHGSQVRVDVSGHGITALVVPVADLPDEPMHREPAPVTDTSASYHFDDQSRIGAVRGLLLHRPDGSGWDAYVQSRCATPAVLRYSLDGGGSWSRAVKAAHPAEWTVRVPPGVATFHYLIEDARGDRSARAELRVPGA